MEGYSQQGFRPGRLAIIIRDQKFPENIGKVVKLAFVHPSDGFMIYKGINFGPSTKPIMEPCWMVDIPEGEDGWLISEWSSGKQAKLKVASYRQSSLMLIDDPDKELDTMEERLNNAHPLLLTHQKEEINV